jgi:hypothetical protein
VRATGTAAWARRAINGRRPGFFRGIQLHASLPPPNLIIPPPFCFRVLSFHKSDTQDSSWKTVESCTTAYILMARCMRGRHNCGKNTQYVYLNSEYDIIDKARGRPRAQIHDFEINASAEKMLFVIRSGRLDIRCKHDVLWVDRVGDSKGCRAKTVSTSPYTSYVFHRPIFKRCARWSCEKELEMMVNTNI